MNKMALGMPQMRSRRAKDNTVGEKGDSEL